MPKIPNPQLEALLTGDWNFDQLLHKSNRAGYARGYAAAERKRARDTAWHDLRGRIPQFKDAHTEVEVLGQLMDGSVEMVQYWPALRQWTAWRPHMSDPDVRIQVRVEVRYWMPKPKALLDMPPECSCKARSYRPDRHWQNCPWRLHMTGEEPVETLEITHGND